MMLVCLILTKIFKPKIKLIIFYFLWLFFNWLNVYKYLRKKSHPKIKKHFDLLIDMSLVVKKKKIRSRSTSVCMLNSFCMETMKMNAKCLAQFFLPLKGPMDIDIGKLSEEIFKIHPVMDTSNRNKYPLLWCPKFVKES